MPSPRTLAIEKRVAAAHMQIAAARDMAGDLADLAMHDWLQSVLLDLERLQEDLLRHGRKPRQSLRGRPWGS